MAKYRVVKGPLDCPNARRRPFNVERKSLFGRWKLLTEGCDLAAVGGFGTIEVPMRFQSEDEAQRWIVENG